MGQTLLTMLLGALLMQSPAAAQSSAQSGQGAQQAAPAPPQPPQPPASPSAAPTRSTSSETSSETGTASRPMTPSEADAAIDKLREAVRESIENERGPNREMSPETQKAIAEAADKFLSDPAIRGAIADQIKEFKMPWQGPGFLVSLLVPISFFAVIGLMATMLYWRSQAKMRARLEFQTQLLSKFGSGQELAAFLNSGLATG